MIRRARLVLLVARPAVICLLALFAGMGLALGGKATDLALAARVMAVITGFLLFSVACNDLADERIDRVNLPGRRPLPASAVTRSQFAALGAVAVVAALAMAATLGWPVLVVLAAGLAVSIGYSLRPVRLADRGVLAALVLPGCYVTVPCLTGLLAARSALTPGDLLLLAGLYLGFIGRILLKDFRDVRGDALFGKRTFLVRHGRRATCQLSACCWLAGTVLLLAAVPGRTATLAGAETAGLTGALMLLRALSRPRGARRDEFLIAAIAIIGRGMMLALLAHLSMRAARWPAIEYDAALTVLALVTAGQAAAMLRRGPIARLAAGPGENSSPATEAEAVIATLGS